MEKINRYDFESYIRDEGDDCRFSVIESYKCDDGQYVDYEDHARIVENLRGCLKDSEELREKMRSLIQTLQRTLGQQAVVNQNAISRAYDLGFKDGSDEAYP